MKLENKPVIGENVVFALTENYWFNVYIYSLVV